MFVGGLRRTRQHFARDANYVFKAQLFDVGENRIVCIDDALGQAVMVAQVDEQQAAVVAFAVNPAGDFDRLALVGKAKLTTSMGAIGVHDVL